MVTMATQTENLNSMPAVWWRSSPFFLTWGGPTVASILSTLFTWLLAHINIPAATADSLAQQLQFMFLTTGGGSGVAGAVGMVARSYVQTKAKIDNNTPQIPQLAPLQSAIGRDETFADNDLAENFNIEEVSED